MATRSVSWRRLCSDVVSNRIDEALNCTIYILQQTGPTGFILKQDRVNKRHKVKAFGYNACKKGLLFKISGAAWRPSLLYLFNIQERQRIMHSYPMVTKYNVTINLTLHFL